jgi:WhiB family transcriptional regulator, redox-sensing transcriptional regulator
MTANPATATATTSPGWREQAACLGTDPALFTDPQPGTDDTRHALAICGRCPVRTPCLNEALARPANADVGIWGATTEQTRRTLRRKPTPPAPPPVEGLFPTLEGDLTDLTGRALITELPTAPRHLLLIDDRPTLRTDHLHEIWHQITTTLPELQPDVLQPFELTPDGDLRDPTGRALITRLPVPPHLLIVIDGRPHSRTDRLDHARHQAHTALARARPDQPRRTSLGDSPGADRDPPARHANDRHHQRSSAVSQ